MTVQKTIQVPVSELTKVRITCKECQVITEIPLDQMTKVFRSGKCPCCERPLTEHEQTLREFALGVRMMIDIKDRVGLEFVLPAPE